MNESETERMLAYVIEDVRALDAALAIRCSHWSLSNILHPGKRHEIELGKRIELVLRLQPCTKTFELVRRPPSSTATLNGTRLVPDVPGLYVVRCTLGGWSRDIELVCPPDALLDKIGPRGAVNNRAHTFRCRINEPSITTAALVAALESNPPTWGALAAPATY